MNDESGSQRWERLALGAWLVLGLVITLRLVCAHDLARQNVYLKVFAPAAQAFQSRLPLYAEGGGFRYPPACAWMFGAFEAMGPLLGSIAWRLGNMLALLAGLRACARAGLPTQLRSGERAFLLFLTLLLGAGGMNSGQANALMLGCMMLAVASALGDRRAAPGAWIAVASGLKVYPFALGMVLAVMRPRSWLAYAIGFAAVAVLPYAVAPSSYINEQYAALVRSLAHEDRTGNLSTAYRDLRLMTAAIGWHMPPLLFHALQGIGGLAIAVCAFVLHRVDRIAATTFAMGATMCWMLLLGPSTEKLTYQLLAVPLAWQAILAWRKQSRPRLSILGAALLLVVVDSFWSPSRELQAAQPWLRCFSPWAALLVTIDLARSAWSICRASAAKAP